MLHVKNAFFPPPNVESFFLRFYFLGNNLSFKVPIFLLIKKKKFYYHSCNFQKLFLILWTFLLYHPFFVWLTHYPLFGASLVAQMVKNLPAMQETWVRSLGWEHFLEKGIPASHSSILAWRIPWTEEPGQLQPIGSQRVGHWLTD